MSPLTGLFILFVCLFSSCTSMGFAEEKDKVKTVTIYQQLRATENLDLATAHISTSIPSKSPIAEKPILTTDIPTQVHGVTENCFSKRDALQPDFEYSGVIAYETHSSTIPDSVELYNLSTGDIIQLKGHRSNLITSPNHQLFALQNDQTEALEIYSADGQMVDEISTQKNWGQLSGWLDNENIVIAKSEPDLTIDPPPYFDKYPRNIFIVNYLTWKVLEFSSTYPDIDNASRNTSWARSGTTVYDPTLTRVIYPGVIQNQAQLDMGYILYDIPEERIIATLPSLAWNRSPVWSPDGSKLILMNDDEFYLISYDGDITKLSRMNPEYDPPVSTKLKYDANYYSWSPDGQHVALWLWKFDSQDISLAVLDIQTGNVVDTCIPAGYKPMDIRTLPDPVWSPDSKHLVVSANYQTETGEFEALLVDLGEAVAYRISTNRFPAGWLEAPLMSSTSTVTAGSPTRTQTMTATPMLPPAPTRTPKPVSTLSLEESEAYVLGLLESNGNCELPCFWGIEPGITSIDTALNFIQYLGWQGGWYYNGTVHETRKDLDRLSFDIMLSGKDNRVGKIHIGISGNGYAEQMSSYSLTKLLQTNGEPTQVWINLATGLEIPNPDETAYRISIYYQNEGILAKYGGSSVRVGSNYRICPNHLNDGSGTEGETQGALSLTLGGKTKSPQGLIEPFGLFDGMLTVEEAFGVSVEDFYRRVIAEAEASECFETPRNIWP